MVPLYDSMKSLLGYDPTTVDGELLVASLCGVVVILLFVCLFNLLMNSFGFFRKNR